MTRGLWIAGAAIAGLYLLTRGSDSGDQAGQAVPDEAGTTAGETTATSATAEPDPTPSVENVTNPVERGAFTEPGDILGGDLTAQRLRENPDLLAGYPEPVLDYVENTLETSHVGGMVNIGPDWELGVRAAEAVATLNIEGVNPEATREPEPPLPP